MGTPKTKEHHWTQPSRHTGRSHEMVRDQVRRNPVESREEGEARRLPVQEEGKEVKAAVFTSSSFASSSFARFTDADVPKLSRLSDVFRLVLKTVIPTTTTKTELSFFLFHGSSRSDKLSVSFSASRHCSLLYSKFPTTSSITYMIRKKLKFRVLFPPKKKITYSVSE